MKVKARITADVSRCGGSGSAADKMQRSWEIGCSSASVFPFVGIRYDRETLSVIYETEVRGRTRVRPVCFTTPRTPEVPVRPLWERARFYRMFSSESCLN